MKRVIRISGKARDVFGALAKLVKDNPNKTLEEICK